MSPTLNTKYKQSHTLDNIYDDAKSAGAIGGKLLGAGGGGYFLFLSKPQNKNRLIKKLKRLQHIDFKFTQNGSEVIKI